MLLVFLGCSAFAGVPKVEVSAGDHDRRNTLVTFEFPDAKEGSRYVLIAEGEELPVQVDGSTGTFILPRLEQGTTRTYKLQKAKWPTETRARAASSGDKVQFEVDGHPVFAYVVEGKLPRPEIDPLYLRSGYIQGVTTPGGVVITDDYPKVAHQHHHSIWFPWTKTHFEGRDPDFWNMGQGKGRVELVALDQTWSGPVHAGFVARHRFVDMIAKPEKTALLETWTVKLYSIGTGEDAYWLFDLESVQTCATDSPLELPEYRYGGIGIRGHEQWDGPEHCYYLPSNGITDRIKSHATRADWCHIGGQVDGAWAGLAIFGHPGNFRSPQPMRVHPKEPFFNFAPSQAGDWAIEPGNPYVSRYRFLVADGKPNKERLNRVWQDYAEPPTAKLLD